LANPPLNDQDSMVAAIGKWHLNLIFSEEGYSRMTKHPLHVKHK
jgi:hypothetical protein